MWSSTRIKGFIRKPPAVVEVEERRGTIPGDGLDRYVCELCTVKAVERRHRRTILGDGRDRFGCETVAPSHIELREHRTLRRDGLDRSVDEVVTPRALKRHTRTSKRRTTPSCDARWTPSQTPWKSRYVL